MVFIQLKGKVGTGQNAKAIYKRLVWHIVDFYG